MSQKSMPLLKKTFSLTLCPHRYRHHGTRGEGHRPAAILVGGRKRGLVISTAMKRQRGVRTTVRLLYSSNRQACTGINFGWQWKKREWLIHDTFWETMALTTIFVCVMQNQLVNSRRLPKTLQPSPNLIDRAQRNGVEFGTGIFNFFGSCAVYFLWIGQKSTTLHYTTLLVLLAI